jgi:hypothetical protein
MSGIALNCPAFIVAAGPSLDNNINELKKVKGKALIIAVDAALKPLIQRDIKPDIVIAVDPTKTNLSKFKEIDRNLITGIPFVFSPYVYHEIPALFTGARFYFNENNLLIQWALNLSGRVETLSFGFSVSHYAFYLARFMGASPIIFTGLDLSFPVNKTHASDCSNTWEHDFSKNDCPTVTDIHGKQIPSLKMFIETISLFEKEIARTDAICIDATEGGALIQGTQIRMLKDVINNHVGGHSLETDKRLQEIWNNRPESDLQVIEKGLSWLKEEATAIQVLCRSALRLIPSIEENINSLNEEDKGIKKTLSELNSISDQVAAHAEYGNIIKDQLSQVIAEQFSNRFRLKSIEDKNAKLLIETRQSKNFFTQMLRNSESIAEYSGAVIEKLRTFKFQCNGDSCSSDRGEPGSSNGL